MKKVLSILLAACLILSLAACGSKPAASSPASDTASAPAANASSADPIVLKFAAHFSNTIMLGETISKAKGILEEKSGGTMTLDMFFNESLIKQSETFVGVGQGIADIAYIPSQNLSDVAMAGMFKILYPNGALDLLSMTQIYRDALANTALQENLAQYNLHCVAIRALGGKVLATSKTLVKSPADLKGMNVAANGNDAYFFTECGAGAVSLSNADYYSSMSNGLVGGLTNHYVSVVTYGINELSSYITEFGSGLEVAAETYMINLDTWNSLTAEQQQWLVETFMEIGDMMNEADGASIVTSRQKCLDDGVEIYTLNDEELEAFRPYMEKVNNDWINKATNEGWDAQGAYDFIINAVENAG